MDIARSTPGRPDPWLRLARRAGYTVIAALLISVYLSAMSTTAFRVALVYSLCISLSSWLLIDLGRATAARFTRPLPNWAESPDWTGWPGWPWMAGIVIVGGLLGYAIGNAAANAITGQSVPGPFDASLRRLLSIVVLALVPAMTITYFFQSRELIARQRTDVATAQRLAAEQQLKLLESQLEPHMLFNTLANLRALIGVDPARAQAMLDRLIAFLRASLAGSRARFHRLDAEFGRLEDYLSLMQVRMGPRLQMRFALPPALASAQVPPLLLQPLVENSIKHGLEPHVAGGRIEVDASREGDELVLRVRDDGAGLVAHGATDGGRYGLSHVRERLATLYGDRASFAIAAAGDERGGTVATVRMPWTESVPAEGQA